MRLAALLSFYNEQPEHLQRTIASLTKAGVTNLVALDGAYALLPGAHSRSPRNQTAAIRAACKTHGIKLTLEQPQTAWAGNEIEKRTRLFALAETVTTDADWYFVIDADETITRAPADLHHRLENSWFDIGEVTFTEPGKTIQLPMLFRAIRGLHCHLNHYTYRTPDGRYLWGNARTMRLEPRLPLGDMYVRHHPEQRLPDRHAARAAYYSKRDRLKIEVHHPAHHPHPHPHTLLRPRAAR